MVERNIQIRLKDQPVILDRVIQDLQSVFIDRLKWLNKAFGRGYKLTEQISGIPGRAYPAAYVGDSEYVSLLPNDNYGNFCWFDIYDPQEITTVTQGLPQFTFSGAIIFWYNLDSIFTDNNFIYSEEIKNEIIALLTTPGIVKAPTKLIINKVYERFDNIYKGYSLSEVSNNIDKTFFLHPYCGLRVEFQIITRELCQPYIK